MNCSFVTRCLCVGPNPTTESEMEELESLGITAVLSVQSDEDVSGRGPDWEGSTAEKQGLTYRNVPVTDFDLLNLVERLPACVRALQALLSAGHRVYVHCTAGVSRSPTVAAAFLHWCERLPLETALKQVREARPGCCPDREVIRRARWIPECERE